MEERLKGLRKSLENTTFKQLNFSEEHRRLIHEKINKQGEPQEEIVFAILQLLVQEKTGYELTQFLRGRRIQRFEGNEGFLYTMLHRLEQNRYIQSSWEDSGAKYYQLTDKGKKFLHKAEKSSVKKKFLLSDLVGE